MKRRAITDEQLAELGRLASQQLKAAVLSWRLGVTCFPRCARERKTICAAGRYAQRNYLRLWLFAQSRGWTNEQVDAVFTVPGYYGWN